MAFLNANGTFSNAYEDRPAPTETHEQFARGEISAEDYEWLCGSGFQDYSHFLVPKKRRKAAHYWNGIDTACRMASTGGLKRSGYLVASDPGGHPICAMCRSKSG